MKYKINKGFVIQKLDNKTVIFDSNSSTFFTFNETASFIFKKIKKGEEREKIIEMVEKKYDIKKERVEKDFNELIADLKKMGLIRKPMIYLSSGLTGALFLHPKSWVKPFYKWLFEDVEIMTCYAEVEREFFVREMGVPKEKIYYIPYGTDWQWFSRPSRLKRTIVAAAGIDSGRDYGTLFAAVKDLSFPVEVACHPKNILNLDVPTNVKVRLLAPYSTVRNMFRRARVVVIPMKEQGRSAGQMVVLESASAKAPIIASAVRGITEAFELKNKQHLWYVPVENVTLLRRAIVYLWNHPGEGLKIGKAASKLVKQRYASKHLAANIAMFLDKLC